MKRLALWLLLVCPLPLFAQSYWADTHLYFGHLKSVALAKCYDNINELIGCYRAVGGALGIASELQMSATARDGGVPVKDFGIVKFFRGTEDDSASSVYQYWQALIEQRNRDVQSLEAHFHDATAERIDFTAIVDFLKTRTPREKESELTARGINEYFAVVFDPHTQISTRHDLADSINGQDKSYVGVGINVFKLGTRYLITSVNPDGPAFSRGVKANDFLMHIDGRSARELSLEQLIALVRGKETTPVALTLMRNGQSLEVVVPRQRISRQALEAKLLEWEKRTYGYVRLQDFMNAKACEKTTSILQKYRKQGAQGWILDLRGNTGGSISIAVCVAGLFLGAQALVAYKIDTETRHRQDYVGASDKVTSSPLVILVDGASASGSELLAGAIQDAQRGWIVGEQTFGKGTAQSVHAFELPGTTGLIRNDTTGLFFLASGRTTQFQGITPDFVVPSRPGATEEEKFIPREKDAYVAPIAYNQKSWISPRRKEIDKVAACIEQKSKARSGDAAFQSQSDYQVLYALDVLDCHRELMR
jgi:carboxyl-terminal processing protease